MAARWAPRLCDFLVVWMAGWVNSRQLEVIDSCVRRTAVLATLHIRMGTRRELGDARSLTVRPRSVSTQPRRGVRMRRPAGCGGLLAVPRDVAWGWTQAGTIVGASAARSRGVAVEHSTRRRPGVRNVYVARSWLSRRRCTNCEGPSKMSVTTLSSPVGICDRRQSGGGGGGRRRSDEPVLDGPCAVASCRRSMRPRCRVRSCRGDASDRSRSASSRRSA
jgi:hypothetical protein